MKITTNPFKGPSKLEKQISQLVPPIGMNYNWGGGKGNYKKEFAKRFTHEIFPYLLQKSRKLNVSTEEVSFLDIGCGWGPMAVAFVLFEQAFHNDRKDHARYLGIDIREDAIGWLSNAYTQYPFIHFQYHQANSNIDYVGAGQNKSNTLVSSSGEETQYDIPKDFVHNWQWSSSVFTHLTPQACLGALKSIKRSSAKKSMQVNTWLIIDEESRYSLASEATDRKLPFDCGDFLTYSESNPLMCTCYKIEAIKRMYKESGLEIVDIDKGSWRGPYYKNKANHYQDIIISRAINN